MNLFGPSLRVRFSLTALLVLPIAAALFYALWLRLAHWGPPARTTCVAYDHSVGLVRDFGEQNWGHHDQEPGSGTYIFARVNGLANTPTDGSSYVVIGLQLPNNLATGQTFDCQPAAKVREVFEIDGNGDSLSKLTQGEYVTYGFAYPRTGWIVANSQPTAKATIKRVSKTRMDIQLCFAAQFAPDVGIVNIDQIFTFDREPRIAERQLTTP